MGGREPAGQGPAAALLSSCGPRGSAGEAPGEELVPSLEGGRRGRPACLRTLGMMVAFGPF